MAIYKYLDVSTAHVTEKDMQLLETRKDFANSNPVSAYNYEHGAFVVICEEVTDRALSDFGYSPSFVKLGRYAREHGCATIRLDCDGDKIESSALDTNDW